MLDLHETATAHRRPYADLVAGPVLNPLMAAGPEVWAQVREDAKQWEPTIALSDVTPHLPFEVADYVDFYSSENHAANVGRIFRPGSDPLPPNWKHLPIGYHGRAGTVVVSGTDVTRPRGQRKAPDDPAPTFGPTRRLDIEAEVGFVVGVPSTEPVALRDFERHVFGVVLLNDWSARDIQAWEYVPLGPFLATRDEVADPHALPMWLTVNGETRQKSTTANLVFGVPALVSYLSRFMTLLPGDVISTGTPGGVGLGMKPEPVYLKPGDVVELGVEGLGRSRQKVVAHP